LARLVFIGPPRAENRVLTDIPFDRAMNVYVEAAQEFGNHVLKAREAHLLQWIIQQRERLCVIYQQGLPRADYERMIRKEKFDALKQELEVAKRNGTRPPFERTWPAVDAAVGAHEVAKDFKAQIVDIAEMVAPLLLRTRDESGLSRKADQSCLSAKSDELGLSLINEYYPKLAGFDGDAGGSRGSL
jgi:hypothetical protein